MNHQRSKSPTMSAQKWKSADTAKKAAVSVAKLICSPLSCRYISLSPVPRGLVRFQPGDHADRLLASMYGVGICDTRQMVTCMCSVSLNMSRSQRQ